MISAAVMGRRGLNGGTVRDRGLPGAPTGEEGVDEPALVANLLEGLLFNIFNPNIFFTLLIGFVTTWFCFPPSPPPPLLFSWFE